MFVILDRWEGEYAVLEREDGETFNAPRASLPDGIRAGDVLDWIDGAFLAAPEETQRRREYARRLQDRLRQK